MLGTKSAGAVRAHHELLPFGGVERHPILRGSRPPPVPLFPAAPLPGAVPEQGMSQPSGKVVSVLKRLRARQEWQFFAVLPKADPVLATIWWVLLILNGAMPAVFAVAIGATVNAVQLASPVGGPLAVTGLVFVPCAIVNPIQTAVSMNLGNKVSLWLNEALIRACVQPPGIGHLEDPDLAEDLTTAREFDRGMTGPPMYLNVDFIATSLVSVASGVASAVVLIGFAWWAPLVLVAAWGSTHWLLRESGIWKDRNTPEVRSAQRHADYAYRLAVDPQPAKELRDFGLAGWTVERFIARRKRLFELQYRATRLREKPVIWCMIIVIIANAAVFGALGFGGASGNVPLDRLVVYAQVALGVSLSPSAVSTGRWMAPRLRSRRSLGSDRLWRRSGPHCRARTSHRQAESGDRLP